MTRPLSPHLQIYKPQLTSVLSITHRATGVVLTLGTLAIALFFIAAAGGVEQFNSLNGVFDSVFGKLLVFIWSFCFFYHLCNGVRHLFWDAGRGFEIETVYTTGKIVVIAAIVLTFLLWIVS